MMTPQFQTLSENAFESDFERDELKKMGYLKLQNGEISDEALFLGSQYIPINPKIAPELVIQWINDDTGHGVFAKNSIPKDSYVCEYVGTIRKNDFRRYLEPLNNYCYQYPILDERGVNYIIDSTAGNQARFINHSYEPNLRPIYAFKEGLFHLIFLALCDIQKGSQLLFNYGKTYWYLRGQPSPL